MQTQKWEKLVWNAAFNGFTALSGLPTRTWLESSDEAVEVTRRLMSEIVDVAEIHNVCVRTNLVDELIEQVCVYFTSLSNSTFLSPIIYLPFTFLHLITLG